MCDLLLGISGPSRQVVSHGSGLSRQVSLYFKSRSPRTSNSHSVLFSLIITKTPSPFWVSQEQFHSVNMHINTSPADHRGCRSQLWRTCESSSPTCTMTINPTWISDVRLAHGLPTKKVNLFIKGPNGKGSYKFWTLHARHVGWLSSWYLTKRLMHY